MKKEMKLFTMGIMLASMAACSSEETILPSIPEPETEIPSDSDEDFLHSAYVSIPGFVATTASRTTASNLDANIQITWTKGDQIGVLPARKHIPEGQDLNQFSMKISESTAGSSNAIFKGNGWSFTPGNTYTAYYPMINQSTWSENKIPVDYTGQIYEPQADGTVNLTKADFLAAQATQPTEGRINFNFKHAGCFIIMYVQLPKAGNVLKKVEFVNEPTHTGVNNPFVLKGEIDLEQKLSEGQAHVITPTEQSDVFTVNINKLPATTQDNEIVKIYFMMPPTQLAGKDIKVNLYVEGNASPIVTHSLITRDFLANQAFIIRTQPADEKTFYVYKPGTLEGLVAGRKLTDMTVMGKINGDDVQFIRSLSGTTAMPDAAAGKAGRAADPTLLTNLNLYNVTIVVGGTKGYVTADNTVGENMFKDCKFTNLVLPLNLNHIGANAFANTQITKLILFKNMKQVAANAFNNMNNLQTLEVYAVPGSVTMDEACLGNLKDATVGGRIKLVLADEWKKATEPQKKWYTGFTPNFNINAPVVPGITDWVTGETINGNAQ